MKIKRYFCRMKKEFDMEALFMFGFVSAIAIVGGIYFWIQDRKELHKKM